MPIEKISLIVPIRNESESIGKLIKSIETQTLPPDEIVIVDGGSVDETVKIVKTIIGDDARYRLIETDGATPGRGRNIGIEQARHEWIALTDAGIVLDQNWLKNLVAVADANPKLELIYGNFEPVMNSPFEKCAAFAYVQSKKPNEIREKFIASTLMKKSVWRKVGGFPDFRAAEDLIFMEAAEKNNIETGTAPQAILYWEMSPDLAKTFHKFALYSKHNVLMNRQWDWHYGLLKQYVFLLLMLLLSVLHSYWWLTLILLWLIARIVKRTLANYYQFGLSPLYNPIRFFTIAAIIITIDAATLVGWVQAKFE